MPEPLTSPVPAWLLDVAHDHLIAGEDPEGYQARIRGLCASLGALEGDVRAVAPSSSCGTLPEAAAALSRASAELGRAAHSLELIGQVLIQASSPQDVA